MKANDVRKKSSEERKKLLTDLTEELREWRFGMAGAAKKNIRRSRALRADIARLKTIHRESSKV